MLRTYAEYSTVIFVAAEMTATDILPPRDGKLERAWILLLIAGANPAACIVGA